MVDRGFRGNPVANGPGPASFCTTENAIRVLATSG